MLIAATGGTARHALALEHAIRPLFTYLRAATVPTGVFAATEDWGSAGSAGSALTARIERAGAERAGAVSQRPPALEPDPYAATPSFGSCSAAADAGRLGTRSLRSRYDRDG